MGETETYYVIMIGFEYLANASTHTTSRYLNAANLFINMDAASWYISTYYRHGMPTMSIRKVKMTVENEDESLS